jgi:hypothetical protein
MAPDLKLPNHQFCRTRRFHTTQYHLCLVNSPINCPQLNIVKRMYLCNHYLRETFSESNISCTPAASNEPMICEHLTSCSLIYNMSKIVPFTINMVKIKYCEFNKNKCARYNLLQIYEMKDIPNDLWPNDEFKGLELMEEKLNESHEKLYGSTREEIPA